MVERGWNLFVRGVGDVVGKEAEGDLLAAYDLERDFEEEGLEEEGIKEEKFLAWDRCPLGRVKFE